MSDGPIDERVGPASEDFYLILEKVKGPKIGPPSQLKCGFHYEYDFDTNMGSALLNSVDDVTINPPLPIVLNNAGIEGVLAFIGGNDDTPVPLPHYELLCTVVWLVVKNGKRTASIQAGEDKSLVYETKGYSEVLQAVGQSKK